MVKAKLKNGAKKLNFNLPESNNGENHEAQDKNKKKNQTELDMRYH